MKAVCGLRLALFFLLCCFLRPCDTLWAAEPQRFTHENPELLLHEGVLRLHFPLSVDNEDRLSDMLRDGARVELRITARISRKRRFWFNAELAEVEFLSSLRHDPLRQEFRLTMPGQDQPLYDPLLRRLLTASWKNLRLPLLDGALLQEGQGYLIELDLALNQAELPPWLESTLIFRDKKVAQSEHLTLDYTVPHAALSR
jgi:hypothetical protein